MKLLMSWGGLFVVLVLFLAVNVFSSTALRSGRFDMTENKLFTLSPGTTNILAKLEEPIRLRFYFSKSLAQERKASGLQSYAERVAALLDEYVARGGGKITLEVADPEPFSETEERAAQFGLKGATAGAGGEMLYFGLAGTNTTDQEEVIEFFQPEKEESLEYDLTKVVYNLAHPKKRVVGILTALPMDGNPMARMMNPNARPEEPWMVVESLRQSFDVRMIPATTDKLEPDVDVLLVVHPQNLSQDTLFAIDQYVLGGGKLIAFVDPYCEAQQVRQDPQNPMKAMMEDRSSNLGALLDSWGLALDREFIAGDRDLALRVGGQGQAPQEFVQYLGLKREKESMNKDDFTVAELSTLNLGSAGILTKKDGATTTITPILETTKNSMRIPKSRIQFGPDPKGLLEGFVSGGEKLMLAARVTGPAKSAFPEGKPKKAPAEGEAPAEPATTTALAESKGPINVIVVSDADMLMDNFWVQIQSFLGQRVPMQFASNGNFVMNAADNMSGSNDLISLRSRGRSIRPFDRVVELQRKAESQYRDAEKQLEGKLREAEQKINELQGNKDAASALILTPEQQAEIEKFRAERLKTKADLRAVKYSLNKDIEALKWSLLRWNALPVPFLVLAIGIGVWQMRRQKMAAARAAITKNT